MKRLSYTLLIAILFVGLTGCGDDSSTGPEPSGNPPQMPDLTEVAQPDVSFFQNNNSQKNTSDVLNATNNYTQAQGVVMWNALFLGFGQTYGTLFTQASQEEATFKNGAWEWSYTYNFDGVSVDYRTIAQELANSVQWETYWSFNDGEGNSVNDYKIFEGTIANDGSTGDWTFNALDMELEEEVPVITSTWNNTSESERELTLEIYGEAIDGENSGKTATIYFEQNGADFSMTYDFADGEQHLITWNTDTNVGSITSNGEKMCWDKNFQDVACS